MFKRGALAAVAGLLCIRGGCGPGIPAPETTCLDRAAPADGAEVAVFELPQGPLPIEFGTQGGQHVFVTFEYYARDHTEWEHVFVLTDPQSHASLGMRLYRAQACVPGWNRVERLNVFVDQAADAPAILKVSSSPLDGEVPARTITATAAVRIVAPQ